MNTTVRELQQNARDMTQTAQQVQQSMQVLNQYSQLLNRFTGGGSSAPSTNTQTSHAPRTNGFVRQQVLLRQRQMGGGGTM